MSSAPLSMLPTGWFQIAWSAEIAVGQVHRMTYFNRELVAWRAASGVVSVMDAFCQHLGAHLGFGGTVVGENIQCPFHGWEWSTDGRNAAIPYEKRPNPARRIRSYPVVERNEAIYMWHDVGRRAPFFDVPDVFTGFDDGAAASDYYQGFPFSHLLRERLSLHPQYVLENGVDFAHFKYVHKVPITPLFTRQDFAAPTSYVDFTITFDDNVASLDDINSGVNAINGGLGIAVTKAWGMIDNRTATAVTPVDEKTCDVRFTVWIGRRPGDDAASSSYAEKQAQGVIDQFLADIEIWSHQRYADPAALTRGEHDSFTAFRAWAQQFYPTPDPSRPTSALERNHA